MYEVSIASHTRNRFIFPWSPKYSNYSRFPLDYENVEEEKEEHEVRITKPNLSNEKNPFKYDSSDDEEGQYEEEVTEMNGISEHEEATNNKMNLCVETFFFKEDDYRLQGKLQNKRNVLITLLF